MAQAAASRYARALADLVLDPARGLSPETAAGELAVFEGAMAGSSELGNVLLSPAVTPARKRAVIARLGSAMGMSRLVRNFLYVVIDHRRTALLPEIRTAFQALIDERTGALEAGVDAARELPGQQKDHVTARLSQLTGKKVRCKFAVDESLIGGMLARIGSTIYDGSVRGQLEALRRRLTD
ncbi:MAG: ATP synthase F1 subunit delta [Acidobacteriales bacterium]|nr:MAG: ATP synthase F1 subunit delta [Terriglobales bacterium]